MAFGRRIYLLVAALLSFTAASTAFSSQYDNPTTTTNYQQSYALMYRVYSGSDGKSHIEPLPLDMKPFSEIEGAYGQATDLLESQGIIFRSSPAGYELGWHTAPRRQLMILLKGRVDIEVGGEHDSIGMKKLHCGPGDVVLAEDTAGQGHITRVVGEEDRFYAILPLADDVLVRPSYDPDE